MLFSIKKLSIVTVLFCVFTVSVNADFINSTFHEFGGADFSNSNFAGIVINPGVHSFNNSNWTGSDLSGAVFTTANNPVHSFNRANFTNVDFSGAFLYGTHHTYTFANFTNANLSGAVLDGNDWTFGFANFTNANLTGATLITPGSSLYDTTLDGANFSGADLSAVTRLIDLSTGYDAASSPFYDLSTIFPTGFDPVAANWRLVGSSAVPEPSTYALMALGLIGLGAYRKQRLKK